MTVNPTGGSKLAKAVQYALNEKCYLYGFLKDLGIEISNNRAENAIRPFVLGRKSWLFSDSPKGAMASAMLYSLVVSAKMNGLNAEEYLVRLFRSDVPVLPILKTYCYLRGLFQTSFSLLYDAGLLGGYEGHEGVV